MRELISFPCEGDTLFGTLDRAEGPCGLLIVSGGNELRIGAHRGMAVLATRIAAAGYPVFRFDRRGIGDSTGANRGFEASGPDIGAAVTAFGAAMPTLRRIVAFGNCDAASALALHDASGIDALVLANPWVIESTSDTLPPAAAIRARYAMKATDPKAWGKLLTGGVNLRKLAGGLAKVAQRENASPERLAGRVAEGLAARGLPTTILLAKRDNTAIAFSEAWLTPAYEDLHAHVAVEEIDTDSHSFHRQDEKAWLEARLLEALT